MHQLLCIINHKNVVIKATQGFGGSKYSKNNKISRIINNIKNVFLMVIFILILILIFIFIIFLCIYKIANITKETYENNSIEVITDELGELWLNEWHIQQKLGHKYLPSLTNKYHEEYKKCRSKLNGSKKQSCRRFIHNDLALKIIMNCRTDESCNLKKK